MAEPNPYVGPRPFQPGDRGRFYGRDGEINQLVPLLYAHRLTVLFAQSGAGKTSLLNAGVLPELIDDEGFDVVGSTRVSGIGANEAEAQGVRNIYTFNALSGWLPADETPPGDATIASFLGDREHSLDAAGDPAPRVVVFDQFEEVFTAYPDRWQERDGFFGQLRDALDADPMLRIVLSLREDYLANLDPHLAVFRGVSTLTFRLERLKEDEALSAVVDPLKGTSRSFAKGVANRLVADLMQVRVEREGELVRAAGEYAEPVQLQVVCARLWQQLPDEVTEITAASLESFGDIDQALTDFYEEALASGLRKGHVNEAKLRDWFQRTLVTSAGTRSTVYQDQKDGTTGGMANEIVDVLEDAHIVRGETLRGSRWFELTHDRFVEPIRTSNAEFRRKRRRKRARWATIGVGTVVAGLVAVAAFFALNEPEPMLDAQPIESGQELTDVAIEAGIIKRYRFSADAKQAVTLELSSADLDAVSMRLVRVEDEQLTTQLGAALAERQRQTTRKAVKRPGGGAAIALDAATTLVRGLPAAEDYAIEVTADRDGTFTLKASIGADTRPPLTPVHEPRIGVVDDASSVSTWVLNDLSAGAFYQVRVRPAVDLDSIITVVDSSNVEIASVDNAGAAEDEVLVVSLPEEGEFVVEVSGFSGSVGVFSIELMEVQTDELTNGAARTGSLGQAGAVDTYTFVGTPGAVVEVALIPGATDLDGILVLESLSGQFIGYADSGFEGDGERLVAQLPNDAAVQPGDGEQPPGDRTYLVRVLGYETSTGDYSIELVMPDPSVITIGSSTGGGIASPDDADVYRFDGKAGDIVVATVESRAGFRADLTLSGPTGFVNGSSGSDPALVTAVLPDGGGYLMVVSGIDGSTGEYDLALASAAVDTLTSDGQASGDVSDGTIDYYEFEAMAGSGIRIDLVSAGFEGVPSFSLYRGSSGELLAFSSGLDEATGALEEEILVEDTYVVAVEFAGQYTLSVKEVNLFDVTRNSVTIPITVGDSVEIEVPVDGSRLFFVFTAGAGDVVDVIVEPAGDLDSVLTILDADLDPVAEVDSGLDGEREIIAGFTVPADGDYLIEVSEWQSGFALNRGFALTLSNGG